MLLIKPTNLFMKKTTIDILNNIVHNIENRAIFGLPLTVNLLNGNCVFSPSSTFLIPIKFLLVAQVTVSLHVF